MKMWRQSRRAIWRQAKTSLFGRMTPHENVDEKTGKDQSAGSPLK